MVKAADRATTNYAAALRVYLEPKRPTPKPLPPPPGRGRPKVLGGIRHEGKLLRAIAEINLANKTLWSIAEIANRLHARPEYKHAGPRQLRRNVAEAIGRLTGLFRSFPPDPDIWRELLGIEPPATMAKPELRRKALELLRYQLMARKH